MQDLVNAALDQGDYRTAAALLQNWKQKQPDDPWLLLAVGRYQEGTGRWESAEKTYLRLLRKAPLPKIMTQARQGIQRVQAHVAAARAEAIEAARSLPGNDDPALLCLEPVQGEARTAAAQGLAKVMQIDPYMARLQVPSKSWRLYRLGNFGELQYLGQSLAQAQMPAFWVKQAAVHGVQTFRGAYFRSVYPQGAIVCQNQDGQLGEIGFQWHEITQVVRGLLPLFESVVDRGAWGKLQRKEATQDYAEVWDLHFHGRKCRIRLCDLAYQFRKGNPLPGGDRIPDQQTSTRPQWNALTAYIREQVSVPVDDRFTAFGEGAVEFIDLMPFFESQIPLVRFKESPWDAAFHLYSGLHFVQHSTPST
jgi:tetratricopeptide (TPR) repeat protein